MNNTTAKIWIFDPIDFHGGSKVATTNLMSGLPKQYQLVVITSHPHHWDNLKHANASFHCVNLWQPALLNNREQGIGYFARQLFLALQLIWLRVLIGRPELTIGASGPGVDLALYLAKLFLSSPLLQCVHGPVACSNTIARALPLCDLLFYLPSTHASLTACLSLRMAPEQANTFLQQANCQVMLNGIPQRLWPTPNRGQTNQVLWAASLLKWKGLSVFLTALTRLPVPMSSSVCYIRPSNTQLAVDHAPQTIIGVNWHENPAQLDAIRTQHSIFVSTSQQEPFGLSILEAMAAGLCPVIPADGAWWHQQLEHGKNCLTYQANDPTDLAKQVHWLQQHPAQQRLIGQAAAKVADQYRAEQCYRPLILSMLRVMAWHHLLGDRYVNS